MTLSIMIPVYNEIRTIAAVLEKVVSALPDVPKEIVIVDDCSADGTRQWLERNVQPLSTPGRTLSIDQDGNLSVEPTGNEPGAFLLRVVFHDVNRGKGAAIATALAAVTGDVIVIQDADLEYDPRDWEQMYDLIAVKRVADVVYGSRFYGRPHRALYFHHYMGNRLISLVFNFLFDQTLSDIEVCYKMFTREVKNTLAITCNDFGFEVQFSAQVARARRWRIYEMGISYYGRTYDEGKKINWKDGLKALWYVVRFRFSR